MPAGGLARQAEEKMQRITLRKELYHMKRILSSGAAIFCFFGAAILSYCMWASMLYGCALPSWWAAGMCIVFGGPAAAGIVCGIARIVRRAKRGVRHGVITPEEIVRALTR